MTPLPEIHAFNKYINAANERGERDLAARIGREKTIALALVAAILKRGYRISVNDGEEWVVIRSTSRDEIVSALFSTDEDYIHLRGENGEKLGYFYLVYGNDGWDVISDYIANDTCEAIWEELRPLMDRVEARA